LSSHILFSFINPFPLGFVTIIMSPLSCTCSLHRAAARYTSCLLEYSVRVNDILHRMLPLCFLIPSYSCLLLALEGHSITNRFSPGGAFTLIHPVINAKSYPSWAVRAVFHCSRSPLYLLAWISLVISLCRYSQHDRSGSGIFVDFVILVGYHFSLLDFVWVEGNLVFVGATITFYWGG
jgi:hypothetical protein